MRNYVTALLIAYASVAQAQDNLVIAPTYIRDLGSTNLPDGGLAPGSARQLAYTHVFDIQRSRVWLCFVDIVWSSEKKVIYFRPGVTACRGEPFNGPKEALQFLAKTPESSTLTKDYYDYTPITNTKSGMIIRAWFSPSSKPNEVVFCAVALNDTPIATNTCAPLPLPL